MQFTPKKIDDGIRVTPGSQLRDFFVLLAGLGVLLIGIYVLLGLSIEWAAGHMSPSLEKKLGDRFLSKMFGSAPASARQQALQALFDRLPTGNGLPDLPYTVRLLDDPEANAAALPGGTILVFSGLVDAAESENELSFVLAHELGHFADRDHLKGFGRSLVLFTMATLLFGDDSSAGSLLTETLLTTDLQFSQEQESRADLFAADTLVSLYGHAGGATDFLERIAEEETRGHFRYFFATHPHPRKRVRELSSYIGRRGFETRNPVAVPDGLRPPDSSDSKEDS